MGRMEGKITVVTGAGSGIGRAGALSPGEREGPAKIAGPRHARTAPKGRVGRPTAPATGARSTRRTPG